MTICLNPCKIGKEFMQLHLENIKVILEIKTITYI